MDRLGLRALCALCGVALLLGCCGCVERKLLLRSEPTGANVTVNGKDIGMTPADVPFITYGDYDIVASAPGYQRLRVVEPVAPPWWETIFLDFIVENVWPGTITDAQSIQLTLVPLAVAGEEGVNQRERALRNRLEAGEGM